jgi:hypothetical protein
VFGSVVAVAFQITFCAEIYQNDVFLFFKNYFWDQHVKTIQNIQKNLIFTKKKLKFFENVVYIAFPYKKFILMKIKAPKFAFWSCHIILYPSSNVGQYVDIAASEDHDLCWIMNSLYELVTLIHNQINLIFIFWFPKSPKSCFKNIF